MNENQQKFLKDLCVLFEKYSIDSVVIFNERIHFTSNNNDFAFASYIRKNNDFSYFNDILTQESNYSIDLIDMDKEEEIENE